MQTFKFPRYQEVQQDTSNVFFIQMKLVFAYLNMQYKFEVDKHLETIDEVNSNLEETRMYGQVLHHRAVWEIK